MRQFKQQHILRQRLELVQNLQPEEFQANKERDERIATGKSNIKNIEIYQPKTEEQSKYYGRNTKWCTRSKT